LEEADAGDALAPDHSHSRRVLWLATSFVEEGSGEASDALVALGAKTWLVEVWSSPLMRDEATHEWATQEALAYLEVKA